jgi:site-specific recombinase XerD
VTFADHSRDFIGWAKINHRSWAKELSRVTPVLGRKKLDEITTADVEYFLASLREGERAVSPASVNRYRDLLSGLFKRALRLGLVASNPVRGIPKLREAERRLVYLPPTAQRRQVVVRHCRQSYGHHSR